MAEGVLTHAAGSAPEWPPLPQAYHLIQHELGIGDLLCSLYGVNGFSHALDRPPIRLYLSDHFGWMDLVDIPGLEVLSLEQNPPPAGSLQLGDSESDYREKLRGGYDPKQWYARKLGAVPLKPPLNLSLFAQPPDLRSPYVVLAPFATRINRTWEAHNWRLLARELTAAGYGVIALDGPGQSERCKALDVEYFWGQPPAWVANVCRHAALLIACDSGLAHVGGLLGTPTLVLLAQQIPEAYFSMTGNAFMVPNQPCVGCRFQTDRGYEEKCDYGCWALQSLSPRDVAQRALAKLGAGPGRNGMG